MFDHTHWSLGYTYVQYLHALIIRMLKHFIEAIDVRPLELHYTSDIIYVDVLMKLDLTLDCGIVICAWVK